MYAVETFTGFSSLRINPSARECAMGGAGVISAIGPSAMYYNPALTATLKSFTVNINYTKWFLDTYQQSIFLTRPLPYFNLGLGVVNFNAGELEYRPDHPTESPYGEFNPVDFNFYLNLSRSAAKMGYGISARVYYEKIYEYTATGIGADVGLSFVPVPNLQVGFSIINFGTTMRFIREDFLLPTKFLAGLNYNINFSQNSSFPKLKIASDLGYLFYDKKAELNSGLELSFKDKYFIRTGYKSTEQANHYNFGFGVIVQKFRIEYAYSPFDLNISGTHHFSLSLGY